MTIAVSAEKEEYAEAFLRLVDEAVDELFNEYDGPQIALAIGPILPGSDPQTGEKS